MIRRFATLAFLAALIAALWFAPPPSKAFVERGRTVRAEVVSVDDSALSRHGVIDYGTERLRVRLPDGRLYAAENELRAQLELDERFAPGDTALVSVPENLTADTILLVRMKSRLGWGLALFAGFALLLLVFGGWTGAKALLSFVVSCLFIWKGLVPLALAGYPVSLVAFAVTALLTFVIMLLVAGWTRTCVAATLGASLGVAAALLLAHVFTRAMDVTGATMPFVQTLLYTGHETLNLQDIFIGAVVLASSGAVMDLAMDIAAGVSEVRRHNPTLGFGALLRSGLRMGRAVVGTMTTTLLLAYSGGYLTLLMVFATQGTSPLDFLNSTLVSAELVKTLVGSFGLVLVAPFTALASAFVHSRDGL